MISCNINIGSLRNGKNLPIVIQVEKTTGNVVAIGKIFKPHGYYECVITGRCFTAKTDDDLFDYHHFHEHDFFYLISESLKPINGIHEILDLFEKRYEAGLTKQESN